MVSRLYRWWQSVLSAPASILHCQGRLPFILDKSTLHALVFQQPAGASCRACGTRLVTTPSLTAACMLGCRLHSDTA